jgi:probable F420-dependent oxidoreductase
MRIGAAVPRERLSEGPDLLRHVAAVADSSELATLWMSDHLLMVDQAAGYPYTEDGSFGRHGDTPWYEAFCVLTWLAALTTRVSLGTSVLVLPQRNPLEVAKVAATLDRLSCGRLLLGVGAGWLEAEFAVLGYDYETRGQRLEASIAVLRQAWTGYVPASSCGGVDVPTGVHLQPTPFAKEGIPVLVGGVSPAALRRAGAAGDGWLGRAWADEFVRNPEPVLAALESVRRGVEAQSDRQGPTKNVLRLLDRTPRAAPERGFPISALMWEAVTLARDAGFDEVAFDIDWDDDDIVSQLRMLAGAVA